MQNQAFNTWFNITPGQYFWRFFAVSFALGLALYGPAILFRKRWQYLYLLIISVFVSFIFIAQFAYFGYSGAFLQTSAVKYAGLAVSIGGTIKTLLSFKMLIFCLNTILVALALIFSYAQNFTQYLLSKKQTLITLLVIVIISSSGYWFVLHLEKHEWGNTSRLYSDSYDLNTLVGKMGIINFSFEDIIKYIIRSSTVKPADIDFVKGWVSAAQASTSEQKYFGIAKGRNVIYIQIESLENSVINQKIGNQEITPSLNELAKEGLYFNNYYSEVGPGNTADAEFVTMNSLYALPDDVAFIDYAQNNYNAFPQLLDNNSYHTYSLHGDVATFWNRSNIYPKLGYQKWFSKDDFTIPRKIGAFDLGDEDFFSQSIPKLKTLVQPFLATLITLSSHTPFVLPDDLNTLSIPKDTSLNDLQEDYLQSIHYTDKAVGEFIDQLKQNDLYNNSIIVIYGDHQSYTNIANGLGTDKNNLPGIADDQIPLIILTPRTKLKATINTPASHLDLYPTIANLIGIDSPKSILGQDILNSKTPVFTHRNSDTGTINTILTDNLTYEASSDGIFENGTCQSMPNKKLLPVQNCLNTFNQQNNIIKTSDIVVKGNLLNLLLNK